MSNFSNRDYLRALSPPASGSNKNVMLAGFAVAGLVLFSITLWIHYRRQIELLKEQNEILLAKLETSRLLVAMPENNVTMDEADPESAS